MVSREDGCAVFYQTQEGVKDSADGRTGVVEGGTAQTAVAADPLVKSLCVCDGEGTIKYRN